MWSWRIKTVIFFKWNVSLHVQIFLKVYMFSRPSLGDAMASEQHAIKIEVLHNGIC